MSTRPPHIPPAGLSDKDPHHGINDEQYQAENSKVSGHDKRMQNLDEQGDQANIRQNTHNKGHQQNR